LAQLKATIKSRKMVRDFKGDPLPLELIVDLLDTARHAPSAGNAQGVEFVVLSDDRVADFWNTTLPEANRSGFPWPGLLSAPVIVIPLADATSYLTRYQQADKIHTKLGESIAAWGVPYWYVDCAFAVQNLLLLAHQSGLGALFFGLFQHTEQVSELLKLPVDIWPLGAVALGYPNSYTRSQSAKLPRRHIDEVVRFGSW